jgi:hypothetical protein
LGACARLGVGTTAVIQEAVMDDSLRSLLICAALGALMPLASGMAACSDSEQGDGDAGAGGAEAAACEPGTILECACGDGDSGSKICEPDGSGYAACYCGAASGSPVSGTGAASASGASGGGGSGEGGAEQGGAAGGRAMVGFAPEVFINHPSDGETRKVGSDIPLIGSADDVEDGMIADPVWASDVEGTLGTGTTLTVQLGMAGPHVLTLSATDSDGNQDVASISLTLEP